MKTVTIAMGETFYWFKPGEFVRISGNSQLWLVIDKTSRMIKLAPWTWVSSIVSWNPCNDLQLALGHTSNQQEKADP